MTLKKRNGWAVVILGIIILQDIPKSSGNLMPNMLQHGIKSIFGDTGPCWYCPAANWQFIPLTLLLPRAHFIILSPFSQGQTLPPIISNSYTVLKARKKKDKLNEKEMFKGSYS